MSHWHSALPFDIIGNIIDFLAEDKPEDLQYVKACSLVCQSFLLLCRPHLFSTITIQITGSEPDEELQNTEAFGQLLLKTPEIARFIRHLNVYMVHPGSQSRNLFNQVLQQLTRLQSLTFWPESQVRKVDWNKISSSMQRSLLDLVHLPTLTRLKLGWISNFPISNLISCTSLKHLSAEALYIVLGEHDHSLSSPSHGHMQLQELDIKYCSYGPELSLKHSDERTVLDFSRLEKMTVRCGLSEVAVTRAICRMTQQLKEVRIEFCDAIFRELRFAEAVTPSLQRLKRVYLTFEIDEDHEDPLEILCEELEEISGRNRLECIEIVVDFQVDEDYHTGDTWGKLERVLLQPGWPMLKHVTLYIIIDKDSPLKVALDRLPETQFARLMSSENLDFQFSICEES